MSAHLTHGQRAMLKAALQSRQSELDTRLAAQRQGRTRAEHARDVLLQDGDDAPQRDSDREVELAWSDQEVIELGAVSRALKMLDADDAHYGVCGDCGVEIPFDRLKIEPHALRCVPCESRREKRI
jgi:DnaK suppressor protein